LFEGDLTDDNQLVYANNIIKGKLFESQESVVQASNNTRAQSSATRTCRALADQDAKDLPSLPSAYPAAFPPPSGALAKNARKTRQSLTDLIRSWADGGSHVRDNYSRTCAFDSTPVYFLFLGLVPVHLPLSFRIEHNPAAGDRGSGTVDLDDEAAHSTARAHRTARSVQQNDRCIGNPAAAVLDNADRLARLQPAASQRVADGYE
jgi:hypothetical protein